MEDAEQLVVTELGLVAEFVPAVEAELDVPVALRVDG